MQALERNTMDERMAYTDVRRTKTQEGSRMPLSLAFDRRGAHIIQTMSHDVRMPHVTSTFATRMTPREQPRTELDVNAPSRRTRDDSPTWLEYQRRHADELEEGRRAMERIAALAADSGDEPYISTGPRPLLVEGQVPHAVRIDPQTRKCDNASRAGTSRGATGRAKETAAGLGGDEFHNEIR